MGERSRWLGRTVALLAAVLGLGGCSAIERGVLAPRGPGAAHILELFSLAFWVAVVVVVVVLGLLAYALLRRRHADPDRDRRLSGTRFVTLGGLVVPTIVLMGLMVATFLSLAGFDTTATTRIDVTGHQFWWELRYPDAGAVSANEIHIPAGEPVELVLHSDDVIHSLWVPELHGKLDLVPGRVNRLVIEADEPGEYRGQCAEFCGLQHARMGLVVIAQERADYDRWLEAQAEPAAVTAGAGYDLFERNSCAACHTIRGTDADGRLGPDLTHLASRRTIAAASFANDRDHLAPWVVNAQTMKPGAEMPPITSLSDDELETLVGYLLDLE